MRSLRVAERVTSGRSTSTSRSAYHVSQRCCARNELDQSRFQATKSDRNGPLSSPSVSSSSSSFRIRSDWRRTSKPISPGSPYPAKEHCSRCGLCDTYYVAHVRDACAFLGKGMSRISDLERSVHGRSRDVEDPDERRFGVVDEMMLARNRPSLSGAQWTGIVTQIAIEMLAEGDVDAVVCVQKREDGSPAPLVARTEEDILASRGVKPTLSPNLNVLATVEALDVKKLLFIGVGCQVQALRAIEKHLNVEELYVLGTHCVDNSPSLDATQKFYEAASQDPATIIGYEFMQDYRVHIKHSNGEYERIPYFCLPANDLNDVIAPSCYSCFDYPNYAADLVVGYMGAPAEGNGVQMTEHHQQITVRNGKGRRMLERVRHRLEALPTSSGGWLSKKDLVLQTVLADDEAKMGRGPKEGAPKFIGELLATILTWLGPKGLEFAQYSIDYHYIRNYIHVMRHWGIERAKEHVPEYARCIVEEYDSDGMITRRAAMKAQFPGNSWPVK